MKTMHFSSKARLFLCLLLSGLFFFPVDALLAQRKSDSKIVFLHLRMKDGRITLINTTVKPGYLKPQRVSGSNGDMFYEVSSASGVSLWQAVQENPSSRRLEYEDPDHPGKILAKVVKQNDVEFTVRVPYNQAIRQISFYNVKESAGNVKVKRPAATLISSIELRLESEGGR